ncbi:plasmid replication initiator protein [Phytohabitans sp. ZYX-F-186]|uniref:Plasmid replication initiator protein n=1 Tax=Phytohabitans maris TaxID=3071409 RepID=A0ABU0ZEQ4_9ACTN|nr:replication initiator [Phytohabitans sp. ZYX-F-186]MDQ7904832.1 plasmid replication initiator protein [Phytohabitans sp. ZYX-F-186]
MTVSTLSAVPEAIASGTAPYAEPDLALRLEWLSRSTDVRRQAVARAARPDFEAWLSHVQPASACMRPIRLAGTSLTLEAGTGRVLATVDTAGLPDGVIYKACGNRRASACPACADRYRRDAYQVIRAGLVGGKGVPEHVASHPALFVTLTAPSFGPVHTRYVKRHTCESRRRCDCRAEPCHPRRDATVCPHGIPLVCYARHEDGDRRPGTPLCVDCYDHDAQVVWNIEVGELWRRTTEHLRKRLRRLAKQHGINPDRVRLSLGKAAEMQRRAVVHLHAIIRLDGADPDDATAILRPPARIDAPDLVDLVEHAASAVAFTTKPHPAHPAGWRIGWGVQVDARVITVAADGEVTDGMVAAYLAKYATKSTEVTGHVSARLTDQTVDDFADPDGTHTERLIDACWRLGGTRWPLQGPVCPRACRHRSCALIAGAPAWRPTLSGPVCPRQCLHRSCAEIRVATSDPAKPWRRLRRWAHMLGFGGHFLTKSRTYSVTFTALRHQRIVYRRTENGALHGIEPIENLLPQMPTGTRPETDLRDTEPTTLVVNFLEFVGAGWHTTADALLANTSAAMAREHQRIAREYLAITAA